MALNPKLHQIIDDAHARAAAWTEKHGDNDMLEVVIADADIMALLEERESAVKKSLHDFNDAVRGLLAIARLTPPEEPGIVDLGEDGRAIARLIRAAQSSKQAREAKGTI